VIRIEAEKGWSLRQQRSGKSVDDFFWLPACAMYRQTGI